LAKAKSNRKSTNAQQALNSILDEVRACQVCAEMLPLPPRPVLSVSAATKILIIGQAPGKTVHEEGSPGQDKSGDTLCNWLGVSREQFLDNRVFGTMPMGFCFPGTKEGGGDFPPRPECAPLWHKPLREQLTKVKLTLIIGQYAIKTYLRSKKNLTETVRSFREYLPDHFPLVHPSPLNFRWQGKNPWFADEVIPELQKRVRKIIS
jgi:uracil-DNA glycosylase